MAVTKVSTAGAIFRIKAVGGAAAAVEIGCVSGDVIIDLGSTDIDETTCFKGTEYSKGALKFGDGTLNGLFDGLNVDAAQTLMIQALYNEGDFATNNLLNIEIEFANSLGLNGTILAYDVLVSSGKATASPTGNLSLDFGYRQQGKPTITAAA